jgi:hypothetical protein
MPPNAVVLAPSNGIAVDDDGTPNWNVSPPLPFDVTPDVAGTTAPDDDDDDDDDEPGFALLQHGHFKSLPLFATRHTSHFQPPASTPPSAVPHRPTLTGAALPDTEPPDAPAGADHDDDDGGVVEAPGADAAT